MRLLAVLARMEFVVSFLDLFETKEKRLPIYIAIMVVLCLWVCLIVAFSANQVDYFVGEERSKLAVVCWFFALSFGYALLWMAFLDLAHALLKLTKAKLPDKVRIHRGKAAVALFCAVLTTSWGLGVAGAKPSVVEYDVYLDRFPSAMNGYKIAVLADLHAGVTVSKHEIAEAVDVGIGNQTQCNCIGGGFDGRTNQPIESFRRCASTVYIGTRRMLLGERKSFVHQWR